VNGYKVLKFMIKAFIMRQ